MAHSKGAGAWHTAAPAVQVAPLALLHEPWPPEALANAAHRSAVFRPMDDAMEAMNGCRQKPLQARKPEGQAVWLQVTVGGSALVLPACKGWGSACGC